jgi:hypothetical protein
MRLEQTVVFGHVAARAYLCCRKAAEHEVTGYSLQGGQRGIFVSEQWLTCEPPLSSSLRGQRATSMGIAAEYPGRQQLRRGDGEGRCSRIWVTRRNSQGNSKE